MDHLFFAIALDLKCDCRGNGGCCNRQQRDEQHQQKDEPLLLLLSGYVQCAEPHTYPCVSGMLWRLLLNTSSTSTETGVIRNTRYRRSMMSPSPAMNTSPSLESNTLRGSSALLANP